MTENVSMKINQPAVDTKVPTQETDDEFEIVEVDDSLPEIKQQDFDNFKDKLHDRAPFMWK